MDWQAEYAKAQEWVKAGREAFRAAGEPRTALAAARLGVVVLDDYPRPQRLTSTKIVAGPTENVQRYVGGLLETDTCTPHYEHMLWQVGTVKEDAGLVIVTMSKSHYAGD